MPALQLLIVADIEVRCVSLKKTSKVPDSMSDSGTWNRTFPFSGKNSLNAAPADGLGAVVSTVWNECVEVGFASALPLKSEMAEVSTTVNCVSGCKAVEGVKMPMGLLEVRRIVPDELT